VTDAELRQLASALARLPVHALTSVRAGGNNRIFRAQTPDGPLALKLYPSQQADPRDRLGTEWKALSFLAKNGITGLPKPIACDPGHNLALYSWIEGEACPPGSGTGADTNRLAGFLTSLAPLGRLPDAQDLPLASAACPAPMDAFGQLRARRNRLQAIDSDHPGLSVFLRSRFDPGCARFLAAAANGLNQAGIVGERALPPQRMLLSPSDFGLHNALRQPDGTLAFVDFEYFGWDDPVKAIADVILHPGSAFDDACRQDFVAAMLPHMAATDPDFVTRFHMLLPVYGLIWCLILLNEFLPERWARRVMAGGRDDQKAEQDRQLKKAASLLDWIEGLHEHHIIAR
jgi:hypothetical protein